MPRVLTEYGGPLPVSEAVRSILALLEVDDGIATLLHTEADSRSPIVTQTVRLAELSGYRIVERRPVPPHEIAALYGGRSSAPDLKIDNRAILDRVLGLLAMAAEDRAMDVQFRVHRDRGIEGRIHANGGFSAPVLAMPSAYNDQLLNTLYNTVASDRRGTFDYTANQEASTQPNHLMSIATSTHMRDVFKAVAGIRHQYVVQYGGHVVELRLHFNDAAAMDLADLGFHHDQVMLLQRLSRRPHGLVPFVGPTGSGKSTAMRAAALHCYAASNGSKHIVEIANPPEVPDHRITLVPVSQHVGSDGHAETFATMIPIAMRLIPDLLLVQETRDTASALALASASVGGHLTMTSMHASGPFHVPNRLVNLGFPVDLAYDPSVVIALPFLALLPGLCSCARPAEDNRHELNALGVPWHEGFRTRNVGGCEKCRGTGYSGKRLIAEVVPTSEELMDLLRHGQRRKARVFLAESGGAGAIRISDHGIMKAKAGEVDVADVLPFVEADRQ